MKANLGFTDRAIRLLFAAVLIGNGLYFGWIWATVIGVIIGVSGLLGRCPVYLPFGISTTHSLKPQGNAL